MDTGSKPPLIIAHRGSSRHAPENTLAAFRRAVADGAEGLEFDVRLTRDGEAAVIHDAGLKRTGRRPGMVADMTARELADVDVGSWFNLRYPGRANADYARARIATLPETLELLQDFTGLIYIELKCEEDSLEALCEAVCSGIRDSRLLPQIIVKSFELTAITHVRRLCPHVRTAALFGAKLVNAVRKRSRIIRAAQAAGAQQISIHYSLATRRLTSLAKEAGLPVTVWTADNPRWVAKGARLGLKAIITNDPARLLKEKLQ